ncbi:two-component system sensor histidine kinase EvgS [Pantoea sp. SORGH_AS 659]|nr:two-component system sensor histidine kinase EvgS [Pantoea sp. SORGH_AS_0659]
MKNGLLFYLLLALLTLVFMPGLPHAQGNVLTLAPRIEVNPPPVTFAANVRAWLLTHPVVRVGVWGASQPPVSLGMERGQLAGIDADYLALLESTLQVHFELTHYRSREEAIRAMNHKKVDMLAIWTPDLSPHMSVHASLPWLNDRAVIVTRAGQQAPRGKLPLLMLDSQTLPDISPSPEAFEDYYQAINSIAFGQSAAAGFSHATASYLQRNNQLDNLWLLPHPSLGEFRLTFGVPAAEPQLLSAINNVLTHLPLVSRLRIAQGWGMDREAVIGHPALSLSPEELTWSQQNPAITVLLDGRREPISYISQQGEPSGLAVDVLRHISERFGLQFNYQIAEDDAQLTALWVKYPQAVLASSLTIPGEPEAADLSMTQSEPWLVTPAVLVMQRNTIQPASLHELEGERITIQQNNPLIPWLETWYPTLQLIVTDTLQQALVLVNNGEAHGAIGSQFSVQYQLKRNPFHRLNQSLSLPVKPYSVGFAAQRADSPALSILNKALQQTPPDRLMSMASSWRDTLLAPDQKSARAFSPTLIAITLLLGLLLFLLVGWWIGRLCQSLKALRERLNSNQTLIRQLQEAKAENDRVLAARNAFMKSMGHEIRTPLNAITGLLELELERLHSQHQHNENLQTVYESACSLLSITGDVFDIFRAEARDEQSRIRVVNLPSLLSSTVALFQQQAEEKGLRLHVTLDPHAPRVEFDPLLIIRITSSLLRNAIQHTQQGDITVTLCCETQEPNGYLPLAIAVSNQSDGLLAERWESLQGADDTRAWAETGFSLAACQRMAQDAGAQLKVNSVAGESNSVSLHFSAAPVNASPAAPRAPAQPTPKVLIVDDYPPARLLLSQQLQKAGCEVLSALDGQQGLTLWQQHRHEIGLVITDCTMPQMDGFAMSLAIRQQEKNQQLAATPIYALTAMSSFDAAEDCRSAGIDGCLTKPITPTELREILSNCLRTKETTDSAQRAGF